MGLPDDHIDGSDISWLVQGRDNTTVQSTAAILEQACRAHHDHLVLAQGSTDTILTPFI